MTHINVESWQGDHKKAQEASFLKRCVKKTRDLNGKLTPVLTLTVTSLLIGASVGIQILLKYVQAQAENEAAIFSLLLSAIASTVVVVVNLLLKWTIKYFVSLEGHDTKTDFEIRVFTMLSMAYLLNTVVMPMVLGAMPFGVRHLTVLDAYEERLCVRSKVHSLVHRF